MRRLAIGLCIAVIPLGLFARGRRNEVPPAPLPSSIVNAKRVFLANGGGSDLAYDAFYSEMRKWGKYEIVGSPNDADLIVEIAYRVEQGGTHVWSATNTYTGATQVYSRQIVDPQLVLTIYDAKSKIALWSATDHRRLARRERNQEKETVKSAERLVEDLETRANIPQ